MARPVSLLSLLIFLTFFGGGFIILTSFLVGGALGSRIPSAKSLSIVLSLMLLLPLAKRFFLAVGLDEDSSRKLALIVGLLSVLVFYMTIPRACGCCRP